ncbi:uncharacterized protein EKO05_0008914 [Ascochyta rabiei]|uniref:uncharacterized protein n=1 Tax=Didymella rabiei TaxID=5454 RepID=UPI00220F181F|nr:uncharacterized protein EKO05_0008914 [Ascochyta rabiei]UPX18620.1 hypothetical protein EKO05_0008914 [Ascochyta rabiei]
MCKVNGTSFVNNPRINTACLSTLARRWYSRAIQERQVQHQRTDPRSRRGNHWPKLANSYRIQYERPSTDEGIYSSVKEEARSTTAGF